MTSFYFDKDSKRKLNHIVPVLDVVNRLGMSTKKMGSGISILCPAPDHNDTHFGSCRIDSKGICYCYVCRKRFMPIDLLIWEGGLSFYDAMVELAEMAGCQDEFIAKRGGTVQKKNNILLSAAERELLGFSMSRNYTIIGSTDKKPLDGTPYIVKGEEYLLVKYQDKDPLRELMEKSPSVYRSIVLGKLKEKKDSITAYARAYGKEDPSVQKLYYDTMHQLYQIAERFAKR